MQEATRRSPGVLVLAAALLCVWGSPVPAAAQQIGAGFIANAPDQLVGGGAYVVLPFLGGAGLYADVKIDPLSPAHEDTFLEDRTGEDAREDEHLFFSEEYSWESWNVALIWSASEALKLYAGAGQSQRRLYSQYTDPEGEIGQVGWYWAEEVQDAETFVNVLGGAIVRLSGPLHAHLGLESAPLGMTVGLSYLLDLR